jgi:succinate dehydrogenase flavin-adding protein (antitoxin of CptAB toxin-antitoxin module)
MQMINKLLYRSRQRGFLELDLLVGLWAEQEVPKMCADMLQQFNVVLDQVSTCLALLWLRGVVTVSCCLQP